MDWRSLVEGFITLAVIKALVEPVARRWGRRRLDAIAPLFYRVADEEVRRLASSGGTWVEVQAVTRRRLAELTGEDWSEGTLQPLWQGWDVGRFFG